MIRTRCFIAVCGTLILFTANGRLGVAQTVVQWSGDTGSYSDESNWADGFLPDAFLTETAEINNGGTAIVDDDVLIEPGGLVLGRFNVDAGSLEIRNGGNLTVSRGQFDATTPGNVQVGQTGRGLLTVLPGGELNAASLSSGGSLFSSIVLGQADVSGTATVAINGTANLQRHTRIVGPNVDFSAQTLTLGGTHALTTEITDASHAPISVTGNANLGGSLHVQFSDYTPANGDSWNLVDAAAVIGDFSQFTFNDVLPPGTGLVYSTESGGTNGTVAQLSVETQLILSIDRRTGQAAIENRTPSESVDIDGYLVTSASEAFTPATWNSLEKQGIAGWTESNPSSIHLGELNLGGSLVLGPESSVQLGSLYSFAPTVIGETGPEMAFEYHLTGGETKPGQIDFTGLHNNVVLLVDPESGAAAIQNQSEFDVEMDGYLITSPSGSLSADDWTSLEASGQEDWTEANPSSIHLGELNLGSALTLDAVSAAISIGSPFGFDAVGVEQDLSFEFHIAGGGTVAGVVEYGGLLIDPLDCNGDGVVDSADLACACGAAIKDDLLTQLGLLEGDLDGDGEVAFDDFLVLSANFGQNVDSYTLGDIDCSGDVAFNDFLDLSANFGKSSAEAAAVPEPTGLSLAILGLLGLLWRRSFFS